MFKLTRILVVIEPNTEKQPALNKAVQLAKFADAKLELFLADYSSYLEDGYYFDPVQAQELRREHGERHLADLEVLACPLREQGLEVCTATGWGNPPFEEIIRRVNETNPSLVLKSTRHHEKIARLLLSNEDWELLRYCMVPLMLVKDQLWSSRPVFIASVDPDHSHDKPASLDHKLIDSACDLAAISNGEVHLFHSSHLPALSGVYSLKNDSCLEVQKINELAKQHSLGDEQTHVSERDVYQGLPELATELDASVVVMGVISRSRLDRILIGNTAEKVLDHLECDVLAVKPDKTS